MIHTEGQKQEALLFKYFNSARKMGGTCRSPVFCGSSGAIAGHDCISKNYLAVPGAIGPQLRPSIFAWANCKNGTHKSLNQSVGMSLGAKAHSIPAPTSQPLLVLLLEVVIDAPVVTLVMLASP